MRPPYSRTVPIQASVSGNAPQFMATNALYACGARDCGWPARIAPCPCRWPPRSAPCCRFAAICGQHVENLPHGRAAAHDLLEPVSATPVPSGSSSTRLRSRKVSTPPVVAVGIFFSRAVEMLIGSRLPDASRMLTVVFTTGLPVGQGLPQRAGLLTMARPKNLGASFRPSRILPAHARDPLGRAVERGDPPLVIDW